jgi:hypothetical protein
MFGKNLFTIILSVSSFGTLYAQQYSITGASRQEAPAIEEIDRVYDLLAGIQHIGSCDFTISKETFNDRKYLKLELTDRFASDPFSFRVQMDNIGEPWGFNGSWIAISKYHLSRTKALQLKIEWRQHNPDRYVQVKIEMDHSGSVHSSSISSWNGTGIPGQVPLIPSWKEKRDYICKN